MKILLPCPGKIGLNIMEITHLGTNCLLIFPKLLSGADLSRYQLTESLCVEVLTLIHVDLRSFPVVCKPSPARSSRVQPFIRVQKSHSVRIQVCPWPRDRSRTLKFPSGEARCLFDRDTEIARDSPPRKFRKA